MFALLNLGFRPFFLGAAGFGMVATLIWMGAYVFGWQMQPYGLHPMTWHAHEMIYGYSMAVIAGFLLTAIKNWTGMQTLNGKWLGALFLLWLVGRVIPFFNLTFSIEIIAVIDNLFMALLVLATMYPIIKARQWSNIGIIAKLVLMLASNIVFYLGVLGILTHGVYWGLYSGVYLILALIFTMGRRVIPFFIEKGLDQPVQLKNWKWLDISSLIVFLLFWIADLATPNTAAVAWLAVTLFLLHIIRMFGWYTHGIWNKPLLWVLYIAYGFIIAGFALKAAAIALEVSPYLSIHAFTYGGIGMMTLGMMSRVILGHTGRSVSEPPAVLFWIFSIMFSGALVRVVFPLIDPAHYINWIALSQLLWLASFTLFLYVFAPMLWRPRVDEQYG